MDIANHGGFFQPDKQDDDIPEIGLIEQIMYSDEDATVPAICPFQKGYCMASCAMLQVPSDQQPFCSLSAVRTKGSVLVRALWRDHARQD